MWKWWRRATKTNKSTSFESGPIKRGEKFDDENFGNLMPDNEVLLGPVVCSSRVYVEIVARRAFIVAHDLSQASSIRWSIIEAVELKTEREEALSSAHKIGVKSNHHCSMSFNHRLLWKGGSEEKIQAMSSKASQEICDEERREMWIFDSGENINHQCRYYYYYLSSRDLPQIVRPAMIGVKILSSSICLFMPLSV